MDRVKKYSSRAQVTLFMLFLSLAGTQTAGAQIPPLQHRLSAPCELTESTKFLDTYSVRLVDGVVYINCLMRAGLRNGILMIERSTDGEHFTVISYKEYVNTPFALNFSFKDTEPPAGESYYRVRYLSQGENSSFSLHSRIVNNGGDYTGEKIAQR